MRELADELERKKKIKEERREAGEREKENMKCLFNERREKNVIKKYFFFFNL